MKVCRQLLLIALAVVPAMGDSRVNANTAAAAAAAATSNNVDNSSRLRGPANYPNPNPLLNVEPRQVPGTDTCACSPSVYELTFDFSLECGPLTVDLGNDGIVGATCQVAGFDNNDITDLVPVAVSSIQFIEIGQDGGPAAVAQDTGDFRDGDSVTYTSISLAGAVAPRAFQVRALGRNAAGEPMVLQWAVTYSNSCDSFPVLEINESVGWTIFTGLGRPLASVCPAAAFPSAVPSSVPSLSSSPTEVPSSTPSLSSSPTEVPSSAPSLSSAPTPVPSRYPTAFPLEVPPSAPSLSSSPTQVPTPAPTQPPTSDPKDDCLVEKILARIRHEVSRLSTHIAG